MPRCCPCGPQSSTAESRNTRSPRSPRIPPIPANRHSENEDHKRKSEYEFQHCGNSFHSTPSRTAPPAFFPNRIGSPRPLAELLFFPPCTPATNPPPHLTHTNPP